MRERSGHAWSLVALSRREGSGQEWSCVTLRKYVAASRSSMNITLNTVTHIPILLQGTMIVVLAHFDENVD